MRAWPIVTCALSLLVGPPAATAAVRYAAPAGGGTACTAAAPCSAPTAIGSAASNDEVILAGGSYPTISSQVTVGGSNVDVHGASRAARPLLSVGPGGLLRASGPSRLADLDVVSTSSTAVALGGGAIGERLRISTSGFGSSGVEVYDSVLRDSTVWTSGSSAVAAQTRPNGTTVTATLRNDTLVATGSGSDGYRVSAVGSVGTTTANVTNTIVVGGTGAAVGLRSDTGGGSAVAKVNLSHSNISSSTVQAGATLVDLGGNQLSMPVKLVAAGSGDFHQLPSSPTVNAGVDAAANGLLDVDGDPRQIVTTDIGADELVPVPLVGAATATATGPTTATISAPVTSGGVAATVAVDYGDSAAYGATTPAQDAGSAVGASGQAVALVGLAPATAYHARMVVSSLGGLAQSADVTFTTPAASDGGTSQEAGVPISTTTTPGPPTPTIPGPPTTTIPGRPTGTPPVPPTPTVARLRAKASTVRSRRAAFVLSCATAGGCAGTLVVTVAGKPTRAVAYTVRAGRRLTVRASLSRHQDARVRHAGRRGLRASVVLGRGAKPVKVTLRAGS